jgi:hypothetical protein
MQGAPGSRGSRRVEQNARNPFYSLRDDRLSFGAVRRRAVDSLHLTEGLRRLRG